MTSHDQGGSSANSDATPMADSGSASQSEASPGRSAPESDGGYYRRQLETVTSNATLALFIMDEHQQCTYMNPAAEHLTGFTLAEVRGRALHDVIHHTHPDGRPYPLEECPIDRAFPENMREQGEEIFVHKDGHFYPVAFTASPIREQSRTVGTIIEVRDITEEKRTQAALRESEARFRTMADTAAVLIWTSGRDMLCDWCNQPWLDFTGRTMEQEVGNGWAEGVHPDDFDRCLQIYTTSFAARERFSMEYRLRRHDGEYRWVLDHGVPRFTPDGTFLGLHRLLRGHPRAGGTARGTGGSEPGKVRISGHHEPRAAHAHQRRRGLRGVDGTGNRWRAFG